MGDSKRTNSLVDTINSEDTRRAAASVERVGELSTLKNTLPPWWWILLFFLFAHQLTQYGLGWNMSLIDNYLDPLLVMPLLLGAIRVERRFLFEQTYLGGLEIVVITITLALLFEEVFPLLKPAFVRDWWDYLMYSVGAVGFYLISASHRSPRSKYHGGS